MDPLDYKARVDALKQRLSGGWTEVLRRLGVTSKLLSRRNGPCPGCGGTDRFQYTDRFGHGDYYCRGCGHGDGFKLLMLCFGWDFARALREVEQVAGFASSTALRHAHEPSAERMKHLAQQIWAEARPISRGDEADRYLCNRALAMAVYPRVLRFHPALGYYEKDDAGKSRKVGEYPALLACVQGPDGHGVTLHRTYLRDGRQAFGRNSKKLLSAGINGAAVRLFEPTEELAVAEGIETALAVHLRTNKPVWAGLSAGNLERLWIPPTVRRIGIYADNDADGEFAGQAAAYILARRLKREGKTCGRAVEVFIPRTPGQDWADVWLNHILDLEPAAA